MPKQFSTLLAATEYATREIIRRGRGHGEHYVTLDSGVYEVSWGGPGYYPYPAASVVASVRFMPGGHVPAYKGRPARHVPPDARPAITLWVDPAAGTLAALSGVANVTNMRG